MALHLALSIHLHDERYHGVAEWPPAPARAYQALVSAAAVGATLPGAAADALGWLERLGPPVIATPRARKGQSLGLFVPNNDADALDGDLGRIGEIRTKKAVLPRLLETRAPFLYVWPIPERSAEASRVVELADGLYQFGRGVDMAWAVATVCDDDAASRLLDSHPGDVLRPTSGEGGVALACPKPGTLESLVARHRETRHRLRVEGMGKEAKMLFAQPPKPRFVEVTYGASAVRFAYDLRHPLREEKLVHWASTRVVALVERLRDGAAERLRTALPARVAEVDRVLIGRKPDGSNAGPASDRVRIVPVPSIGHEHADQAIRRVLVIAPSTSPIHPRDIDWAFSGLELWSADTGEVQLVVTPTDDRQMVERHYETPARAFRTITPAALPAPASRRRIASARRREDAKSAEERIAEESQAGAAVRTALRHAGFRLDPSEIRVQREPFDTKGARVELFDVPPRFPKERLWHVQVTFREPVRGPIVIGDGRFLGLGCMTPILHRPDVSGVLAFEIRGGLTARFDPMVAARALRRAVMARVAEATRGRELAPFFTGHDAASGKPSRDEQSSHVAFHAHGRHLWIIAPHRLDRRPPEREEQRHWKNLEGAVEGMDFVRAGQLGVLEINRLPMRPDLLESSTTWRSVTAYQVQRHERANDAGDALRLDVVRECSCRGLPRPEVRVISVRAPKGRGLEGEIELRFATAVDGPLLLGRSRFLGGGLFAPEPRRPAVRASTSPPRSDG